MTDLKLNYPSVPDEASELKHIFESLTNLPNLLRFPSYQGTQENLEIAISWLKINHFLRSGVSNIVECNSGNGSISCVLQALKDSHSPVMAERFTYPAFKAIALENGYKVVPLNMDQEGITVESLEECTMNNRARLLYIQPTIQNPTCAVMSLERRKQIVEFARKNNLCIIEDDAYRFLHPDPPIRFLDLYPENTIHICSLSKPFNPLIKTAYIICPNAFYNVLIDKVRLSSSGNSSLLSAVAGCLLRTKRLEPIILQKQELARQRQVLVQKIFEEMQLNTFATSFHLWLNLPNKRNATELVTAMKSEDIIIPGGYDFAVGDQKDANNFVRIALGGEPDSNKLEGALKKIAEYLKA